MSPTSANSRVRDGEWRTSGVRNGDDKGATPQALRTPHEQYSHNAWWYYSEIIVCLSVASFIFVDFPLGLCGLFTTISTFFWTKKLAIVRWPSFPYRKPKNDRWMEQSQSDGFGVVADEYGKRFVQRVSQLSGQPHNTSELALSQQSRHFSKREKEQHNSETF
jgi:hypothetical protein